MVVAFARVVECSTRASMEFPMDIRCSSGCCSMHAAFAWDRVSALNNKHTSPIKEDCRLQILRA